VGRQLDPLLPTGALAGRAQPTVGVGGGAGVVLRPWRRDDVPALVAAYEDPGIAFWHHRTLDDTEAAGFVDATADAWRAESDAEWAVTRDDDVLGRVALRGIALEIGQAEVSYWTVPSARGAGVARGALDRVASWALDEVGFWRLVVSHSTRNEASCRVATAAAFPHEATLARCHLHADGWHDVHVHTRFRETVSDDQAG
jgi:ribosomal-protein-alanine N-acetyltransferase